MSCQAQRVHCQQNRQHPIQSLEFRWSIATHKEPCSLTHKHIHLSPNTFHKFRCNTTENWLIFCRGQDCMHLVMEQAQKIATARPFPFTWQRHQYTAAPFAKRTTESNLVNCTEFLATRLRPREFGTTRVGPPCIDKLTSELLWWCMTNGGKPEICQCDVSLAKIVEYRTHLMNYLNNADEFRLFELLCCGSHCRDNFCIIDVRWRITWCCVSKEAMC